MASFLRPLNVPDPQSLYSIERAGDRDTTQSYLDYLDIRERNRSFVGSWLLTHLHKLHSMQATVRLQPGDLRRRGTTSMRWAFTPISVGSFTLPTNTAQTALPSWY